MLLRPVCCAKTNVCLAVRHSGMHYSSLKRQMGFYQNFYGMYRAYFWKAVIEIAENSSAQWASPQHPREGGKRNRNLETHRHFVSLCVRTMNGLLEQRPIFIPAYLGLSEWGPEAPSSMPGNSRTDQKLNSFLAKLKSCRPIRHPGSVE